VFFWGLFGGGVGVVVFGVVCGGGGGGNAIVISAVTHIKPEMVYTGRRKGGW